MKKINKKLLLIPLLVLLVFVTGCDNNTTTEEESVKTMKHVVCTRQGEDTNLTASMKYDIYTSDGYIKILKSQEEVTSNSQEVLDEYENAYRKIFKVYDSVEHYNTKVTREDNKVIANIDIDYRKVDMDKIVQIENITDEDNLVIHGKIKLSNWKKYMKKVGVTCDK